MANNTKFIQNRGVLIIGTNHNFSSDKQFILLKSRRRVVEYSLFQSESGQIRRCELIIAQTK